MYHHQDGHVVCLESALALMSPLLQEVSQAWESEGENQRYNIFSRPRCWDAKQNTAPQFCWIPPETDAERGYGTGSPAPEVRVEGKEHLRANWFKLFHQLSNVLMLSFHPKNQICAPSFSFFFSICSADSTRRVLCLSGLWGWDSASHLTPSVPGNGTGLLLR